MKASVNFIVINEAGKKTLSRWKEATVDLENRVFMTEFDEEILIQRGDVIIAELHFKAEDE